MSCKAVNKLVCRPTTCACPVSTEITGAMNAVPSQRVSSVPVHMEIISTPESLTSPNQVQVKYRVESEQSDLSEDENSVLEVQCEQKRGIGYEYNYNS